MRTSMTHPSVLSHALLLAFLGNREHRIHEQLTRRIDAVYLYSFFRSHSVDGITKDELKTGTDDDSSSYPYNTDIIA